MNIRNQQIRWGVKGAATVFFVCLCFLFCFVFYIYIKNLIVGFEPGPPR